MDRSGPTDVLAFPVTELTPGRVPTRMANDPPVALGDVFLCPEVIKVHAKEEGKPFGDWMHLLVAHGILHLLGYDHADDRGAEQMELREQELLLAAGKESL
jgi:probable rRNA maturation factor